MAAEYVKTLVAEKVAQGIVREAGGSPEVKRAAEKAGAAFVRSLGILGIVRLGLDKL